MSLRWTPFPKEKRRKKLTDPVRDDYILIKVKAVALNPTDWKHIAFISPPGSKIGCDYAGIVEVRIPKLD